MILTIKDEFRKKNYSKALIVHNNILKDLWCLPAPLAETRPFTAAQVALFFCSSLQSQVQAPQQPAYCPPLLNPVLQHKAGKKQMWLINMNKVLI